MKKYELIEHTADVRIKALASSIDELYGAALEGMCRVLCPDFKEISGKSISKGVFVESIDRSALIVDFLSECLYLMNVEKALLFRVDIKESCETEIKAEISGVRVDSFEGDVKAVTYHEAEIIKNESGLYETVIILDI